MNDNNNNSDKKGQNIIKKYIDLLNSIILSLKNKPIKDLQEISDESIIFSLILEIEPNFEKIPFNNKVEISKDLNLEKRYNNFNSIFQAVVNYKNESKSKDTFTKETNFTNFIVINDLLNNDQEQLLKIAEMLCFLTIISSNKNYYIEKVNEIDDNQLSNLYYSIIEKYITFKIDESISSVVKKTNIFINQVQNVKAYNLKNDTDKKYAHALGLGEFPNLNEGQEIKTINPTKEIIIEGYNDIFEENKEDKKDKRKDIYSNNNSQEKEKILLQMKVDNLTQEISKMKENFQNLEKEKRMLEENINELREINYKLKEEHSELKIERNTEEKKENNDNISKELNNAYQKINDLKNENERLHNIIGQINNEKENLEIQLKNTDLNLKQLALDNEKMKENEKIKENNYNESISNDKYTIDKLKEDLNYQIQINEIIKEENEIMKIEIQKYKSGANNNNINQNKGINNKSINENNKKNCITNNESELKNEIQKLKNNLVEKDEKIKKLEEINLEKEKDREEDANFYKKSYEEQKIRVNEEHKLISESLYKLAIHFMTLKDDLQKKINSSNSDK